MRHFPEGRADENATQRGHNAGAQADSVAAYARIVAKAILLGDEEVTRKFFRFTKSAKGGGKSLERMQSEIAEHGPGVDIIYRAANRFSLDDRDAIFKEAS